MPVSILVMLHNFTLNLSVSCIIGALWEPGKEVDWLWAGTKASSQAGRWNLSPPPAHPAVCVSRESCTWHIEIIFLLFFFLGIVGDTKRIIRLQRSWD